MHLFAVLNPAAGRTSKEELRATLERSLAGPEHRLDIHETTGSEKVASIVREAIGRGVDVVVVAGGDGTVSDVVDGLVGSDVPLAIVPAGTGNVLAQELGIPLDVEKACRLVTGRSTSRRIDALQVGESYYVLSVGTGVDAQAIQETSRAVKRRLGVLAYVWATLRAVWGAQPHMFTIVADGRRKRVRAASILMTNISTLAGTLRWGPHIRPDDGRIDICIIRANSPRDYLLVARDILLPGRPRQDRNLRYWSARSDIMVFADQRLPVQGDGDVLGKTPIEVRVVPAAVRVLVPPNEAE
jgi:YegS/Rv2252/BmrU family lipid kinase